MNGAKLRDLTLQEVALTRGLCLMLMRILNMMDSLSLDLKLKNDPR